MALDNELDTELDLNARCHASVTLSRLFPRWTNEQPRFGAEAVPPLSPTTTTKLSTRLNNGRRYVLSITSDDDEGDCVCGYAGGDGSDDVFSHFPRRVRCQPANYPLSPRPPFLVQFPTPSPTFTPLFWSQQRRLNLFIFAVP